ncbi:Hypothetical protein FKW44_003752 [Caligus rogercresseyi]|uniref:Uncharacterized protein n=1 Tax=Caligus rogercresseyi TaxID=217165 RepID=A0A7T8KMB5_CALRO|nr:Hypothetical protein FKW44_003752 [Caligus rogercresseyi]
MTNFEFALDLGGLKVTSMMKVLGTFISLNDEDIIVNAKVIEDKVQKTTNRYAKFLKKNTVTRIFIWNTFILPKTIHILRLTPFSQILCKKINDLCEKFLFPEGRPKIISWRRVKTPKKFGGLGLLELESFWKVILFKWLKRLLESGSVWTEALRGLYLKKVGRPLEGEEGNGPHSVLDLAANISPFGIRIMRSIKR